MATRLSQLDHRLVPVSRRPPTAASDRLRPWSPGRRRSAPAVPSPPPRPLPGRPRQRRPTPRVLGLQLSALLKQLPHHCLAPVPCSPRQRRPTIRVLGLQLSALLK
jgi:hypothetical protein